MWISSVRNLFHIFSTKYSEPCLILFDFHDFIQSLTTVFFIFYLWFFIMQSVLLYNLHVSTSGTVIQSFCGSLRIPTIKYCRKIHILKYVLKSSPWYKAYIPRQQLNTFSIHYVNILVNVKKMFAKAHEPPKNAIGY